MISTDIVIIGAGPAGLFTVFEAGLLKMRCHLIDSLPQPGGQCTEIYPKKPIYDIPGFPEILAGDLVKNLLRQIQPFNPGFTLGERAETLERFEDGTFMVTTNKHTQVKCKVVAIAGGLGSFEPRKPPIENIDSWENRGLSYFVNEPEKYKGRKVVIAGGGDSALDWSIYLVEQGAEVTLIHRRNQFRGAPDSVDKVTDLKSKGLMKVITPAEVIQIKGNQKIEELLVKKKDDLISLKTDFFIPLFGLIPRLGPLEDWGLEIKNNAIKVNNALDYQTNIAGVFAIGDINTYPGKLKLILSGFHEAALMCQGAFKHINPNKKNVLKYTTVTGIQGFDGSVKQAEKPVIKNIN